MPHVVEVVGAEAVVELGPESQFVRVSCRIWGHGHEGAARAAGIGPDRGGQREQEVDGMPARRARPRLRQRGFLWLG